MVSRFPLKKNVSKSKIHCYDGEKTVLHAQFFQKTQPICTKCTMLMSELVQFEMVSWSKKPFCLNFHSRQKSPIAQSIFVNRFWIPIENTTFFVLFMTFIDNKTPLLHSTYLDQSTFQNYHCV